MKFNNIYINEDYILLLNYIIKQRYYIFKKL